MIEIQFTRDTTGGLDIGSHRAIVYTSDGLLCGSFFWGSDGVYVFHASLTWMRADGDLFDKLYHTTWKADFQLPKPKGNNMIRRAKNYTLDRSSRNAVYLGVFGLEIALKSGRHSEIEVFHDSEGIYVLSINRLLRYVTLDVYDRATGEHSGDVFIRDPDDSEQAWLVDGKQSGVKVRYLLEYIY